MFVIAKTKGPPPPPRNGLRETPYIEFLASKRPRSVDTNR
jgi:hypothetical protein